MKVETNWPYPEEEKREHYQNGHDMASSRKKESVKTGTVTETYRDKELENIGKTWGDVERFKRTVFGGELWWKPYTSRGETRIK